jgi:large subunit ribosomal protein L29
VKARELREKTTEDLVELRETLRRGLFNLRFRSATDRVEKTSEFQTARRDIARIETILTERRRAAPSVPGPAPSPSTAGPSPH